MLAVSGDPAVAEDPAVVGFPAVFEDPAVFEGPVVFEGLAVFGCPEKAIGLYLHQNVRERKPVESASPAVFASPAV